MEANNKMLLNESNFVVCSPLFQKATPWTHEIACLNCLKMGAEKIFSEIKDTCKMLSNEPTFVVCSPFFQYATPGTNKIACKNFFLNEAEVLF